MLQGIRSAPRSRQSCPECAFALPVMNLAAAHVLSVTKPPSVTDTSDRLLSSWDRYFKTKNKV